MLGTVIIALYVITHLILTAPYEVSAMIDPHFTEEETEAQRG